MDTSQNYIAVDLGAESGRVMLGCISGEKLSIEEIHRFENRPLSENNSLRWDFFGILSQIKTGIKKAVDQTNGEICGIGIDSWGVDFGLLDDKGSLIENPHHYRDNRTNGVMEKACEIIGRRSIYEQTGIQFMQINSLYQLYSMKLTNSPVLKCAKTLLFIADLFAFYLCGRPYAEYTLASTSQMMDMKTGLWAEKILESLGLSSEILPPVIAPGTVVGKLTKEVSNQLGCQPIPVIAVASHDTASAVAAIPAGDEYSWAFLSSGTWSLLGAQLSAPVINDKTYQFQFTNEGGVGGTIRLLKNIMGLWLIQQCRSQWQQDGQEFSYSQLTILAEKAVPFAAYIDPTCSLFLTPGNMPTKINDYLVSKGNLPIEDKGLMIRSILESLALNYSFALERLEEIINKRVDCLHIVGGGIKNELLCQFTANATGKIVYAGPVEATAAGNILLQALATGRIRSIKQIRSIVRNSFKLKEYAPQDIDEWKKQSNLIRNLYE